jgi:DNA polymerase
MIDGEVGFGGTVGRPDAAEALAQIQSKLADCRRCQLAETRTNIVFGVGNPNAEVMFVGEAPGKQEDLGAEPFIGAAGKYLNELLGLAGLKREEIYIANVLKCRPPDNRNPLPDEIEICTPYLREQVRTIAPMILVTLGNFATRFILRTDVGISNLRGKVHITGAFSVLPIFHPAAAIYDQLKKPKMEADFRLLGRLIETRRAEFAERAKKSGNPTQETVGHETAEFEVVASNVAKNQTTAGNTAAGDTTAGDNAEAMVDNAVISGSEA